MYEQPGRLVEQRLGKLAELRELGIEPYPAESFAPTHSVSQARSDADALIESEAPVRVAGRIVSRRPMGRVEFWDISGGPDRIQLLIRVKKLAEPWNTRLDLLSPGDFVGVVGPVIRTKTGETTVSVTELVVLSKSTHPIQLGKRSEEGSHDVIQDRETLLRHRHLDLLNNPESLQRFQTRSRVIAEIRQYLYEEGFLEAETPVVGRSYSGAAARPFKTELWALSQPMFLRISLECPLKRLMIGGIEKVYELGRCFRNEGIDASHNPEFTMLEWYEAYSDYKHQMERFETLISRVAQRVLGTTKIAYQGTGIELAPPWRRLTVADGIAEHIGVRVDTLELADLGPVFAEHHPGGVEAMPTTTWGEAVMELFEAVVEPHLVQPTFVLDHPAETSPLTKRHRSEPRLVERFEPYIAGMEVGNSYSELNDPVEQYRRLAKQNSTQEEQYDLDEDFLLAMAHGMPQAGGTGVGVDRIVMLLTDASSIRDVIFFPFFAARDPGPGKSDEAAAE